MYRRIVERLCEAVRQPALGRNLAFHPIRLQHRRIEPARARCGAAERYERSMRERFIEIRRAISATVARFIRSPPRDAHSPSSVTYNIDYSWRILSPFPFFLARALGKIAEFRGRSRHAATATATASTSHLLNFIRSSFHSSFCSSSSSSPCLRKVLHLSLDSLLRKYKNYLNELACRA